MQKHQGTAGKRGKLQPEDISVGDQAGQSEDSRADPLGPASPVCRVRVSPVVAEGLCPSQPGFSVQIWARDFTAGPPERRGQPLRPAPLHLPPAPSVKVGSYPGGPGAPDRPAAAQGLLALAGGCRPAPLPGPGSVGSRAAGEAVWGAQGRPQGRIPVTQRGMQAGFLARAARWLSGVCLPLLPGNSGQLP